jgi:hypothetical protein
MVLASGVRVLDLLPQPEISQPGELSRSEPERERWQ